MSLVPCEPAILSDICKINPSIIKGMSDNGVNFDEVKNIIFQIFNVDDNPLFSVVDIGKIFGKKNIRQTITKSKMIVINVDYVKITTKLGNDKIARPRLFLTQSGLTKYLMRAKGEISEVFVCFISSMLDNLRARKINLLEEALKVEQISNKKKVLMIEETKTQVARYKAKNIEKKEKINSIRTNLFGEVLHNDKLREENEVLKNDMLSDGHISLNILDEIQAMKSMYFKVLYLFIIPRFIIRQRVKNKGGGKKKSRDKLSEVELSSSDSDDNFEYIEHIAPRFDVDKIYNYVFSETMESKAVSNYIFAYELYYCNNLHKRNGKDALSEYLTKTPRAYKTSYKNIERIFRNEYLAICEAESSKRIKKIKLPSSESVNIDMTSSSSDF
jgi:hypothetical protein